jgi:hypothetical protein
LQYPSIPYWLFAPVVVVLEWRRRPRGTAMRGMCAMVMVRGRVMMMMMCGPDTMRLEWLKSSPLVGLMMMVMVMMMVS